MGKGFNNFHDILNDKKIAIIIKNFFWDINGQFLKQTTFKNKNIDAEPKIEKVKGCSDYYYYTNLELIDLEVYETLTNFEVNQNNLNQRECHFENNYMYFDIPSNLCGNKSPRNIEICFLNQNIKYHILCLVTSIKKNNF